MMIIFNMRKNIENIIKNNNIHEYSFLDPKIITYSNQAIEYCKDNQCGNYGKCHSCPPYDFEYSSIYEKIKLSNIAVLFTTLHSIKNMFDSEEWMDAKKIHDLITINFKLSQQNQGYMFGAGKCMICDTCTYPKPCSYPEKLVFSLEGIGVDVVSLAKKANLKYYNGENTITYFSLFVV